MYTIRNYRIFDVNQYNCKRNVTVFVLFVRHDKFVRCLDMINSCGFYAGNNVKVAKHGIKYAIYF